MTIAIDANVPFATLNENIRACHAREIVVDGCLGQRYIAAGLADKRIVIKGTPGNALAAYLDGADVTVFGNAQDATGDTMNRGTVTVHGSAGDATGYAMRGGRIYIKGSAGYRTGIHMKAYKDQQPAIVIGGCAGSFLGEYQAGGIIVVLGLGSGGRPIVNNFCGAGMHGGEICLRCAEVPQNIPAQVAARTVHGSEVPGLRSIVGDYCTHFPQYDADALLDHPFTVLTPNSDNPYRQMYTLN